MTENWRGSLLMTSVFYKIFCSITLWEQIHRWHGQELEESREIWNELWSRIGGQVEVKGMGLRIGKKGSGENTRKKQRAEWLVGLTRPRMQALGTLSKSQKKQWAGSWWSKVMARAVGILNSSEKRCWKARTSGWLGICFWWKTLEDEVAQGNARFVLKRMSLVPSQPSRHGEGRMANSPRRKRIRCQGRKRNLCILANTSSQGHTRPSLHLGLDPQSLKTGASHPC